MAAAPRWKVYRGDQYIAACKYLDDAAALVAFNARAPDGATIRDGHSPKSIVWTEGKEDQPASESYDHVVEVCWRRADARRVR